MDLKHLAKRGERFLRSNSPEILAGVGISGVVGTAYLAYGVGHQHGWNDHINQGETVSLRTHLKMHWKNYIPVVAMGTATIACIVGGTKISSRRTAAMAAAYSISEHAFLEYKEQVKEKFGESKERAVRDEVAKNKIQGNPLGDKVVLVGSGNVMCCELQTMRYFLCDVDTLKKAQNEINDRIIRCDYANLAEFYTLIGQVPSAYSQDFGWYHDRGLMEVQISAVLMNETQPCIGFDFNYLAAL